MRDHDYIAIGISVLVVAFVLTLVVMLILPGPIVHGTVAAANCNGGFGGQSNVIVNMDDGSQRVFNVHYDTCTVFAQHVGGGVTIWTYAYAKHDMSDYAFDSGPVGL